MTAEHSGAKCEEIQRGKAKGVVFHRSPRRRRKLWEKKQVVCIGKGENFCIFTGVQPAGLRECYLDPTQKIEKMPFHSTKI